jgi:hypothetical protein
MCNPFQKFHAVDQSEIYKSFFNDELLNIKESDLSVSFKNEVEYDAKGPGSFIYASPKDLSVYEPEIDLHIWYRTSRIIEHSFQLKTASEDLIDLYPLAIVDRVFKVTRPLTESMLSSRLSFEENYRPEFLNYQNEKYVKGLSAENKSLYVAARFARLQCVKYQEFYVEKFTSFVEVVTGGFIPSSLRNSVKYLRFFDRSPSLESDRKFYPSFSLSVPYNKVYRESSLASV